MGSPSTLYLPTFGAREDYKADGDRVRIPQAYYRLLPAPAAVACTGAAVPPRPPTVPPTEPDGDHVLSPGTGESEESALPWGYIGAAAGAAALLTAVWYFTRRAY